MSDYTKQERIERASAARRTLNDPLLLDAKKAAVDELIDGWLNAPEFDENRARVVWATAKALELVDHQLRKILSDGQIAAASQ